MYTRRDLAKIGLAAIPVTRALAAPNSRINGVQIGVITYSFRSVTSDVDEIIRIMTKIGLNEVELMSNSAEQAAGAPQMPRMGPPPGARPPAQGARPTPEQIAEFKRTR